MGRKEFLVPGLVFVMLPIPMSILLWIFFILSDEEMLVFVVVSILFLVLLFFVPAITRRLHDIGMSGWFSVVLYLTAPAAFYCYFFIANFITVLILNFIINANDSYAFRVIIQENLLLSAVLSTLALIYILSISFLFFKRGGVTENKYGTTPVYDKKKQKVLRIAFTILTIITIISHGFVLFVYLSLRGLSSM